MFQKTVLYKQRHPFPPPFPSPSKAITSKHVTGHLLCWSWMNIITMLQSQHQHITPAITDTSDIASSRSSCSCSCLHVCLVSVREWKSCINLFDWTICSCIRNRTHVRRSKIENCCKSFIICLGWLSKLHW